MKPTPILIRSVQLLLAAAFMVAISGCGPDNALTSPTALHMKGLANAYLDHVVGANGPPADEATFKKHLKGPRPSVQYDYHVNPDNLDASFVSERDGQPLVV